MKKTFGVFLATLLMGCEMENALFAPASCVVDEKLFGTWQAVEHKFYREEYYVIGKAYKFKVPEGSPDGLMIAVDVSVSEDFSMDSTKTYFVTANVAGESYLMVIDDKLLDTEANKAFDFSKQKRFYIAKYRLTGDTLELWKTMDLQAVDAAIANGTLKGRTSDKNGTLGYPSITESPEGMIRYLSNGGSKTLFTDVKKYKRSR